MSTPNPRGYPHQSAIARLQNMIRETVEHWSFDNLTHQRQSTTNRNQNPLWYMKDSKRRAVQSALDDLGL